MPTIDLSEATFRRLQAHAKPLVDSASSVIDRLLDAVEGITREPKRVAVRDSRGQVAVTKFGANDAPPLTHTKLRTARFGDIDLPRPNWNELMRAAIEAALDRMGSLEEVLQITDARVVQGTKIDEGFSPISTRGISVQGVAANDAWRISYGLARKLRLPIDITFEWREKDGADRPGEIGSINWSP